MTLWKHRPETTIELPTGALSNPLRLESHSRAKTEPRADNSTEAGGALNRRIELWILPVLANRAGPRL